MNPIPGAYGIPQAEPAGPDYWAEHAAWLSRHAQEEEKKLQEEIQQFKEMADAIGRINWLIEDGFSTVWVRNKLRNALGKFSNSQELE